MNFKTYTLKQEVIDDYKRLQQVPNWSSKYSTGPRFGRALSDIYKDVKSEVSFETYNTWFMAMVEEETGNIRNIHQYDCCAWITESLGVLVMQKNKGEYFQVCWMVDFNAGTAIKMEDYLAQQLIDQSLKKMEVL